MQSATVSKCLGRQGFNQRRYPVFCSLATTEVPTTWVQKIKQDFPILKSKVNGKDLVYLDNAATSQKPNKVLHALEEYYQTSNSNVHRGVHYLSATATQQYEQARDKVAAFINANSSKEVVFVRNASEGINLVAYSWGLNNLTADDEIIVSVAEHHSNIVPWQIIAQKTGATLKFLDLNSSEQELDMDSLQTMVTNKTKLICLVHVSNAMGFITPIDKLKNAVKGKDVKILLDCCQSIPHMPVDVQQLGADWIVASGHKMCAPTGIGFLWGRYSVLEQMQPFIGGGEMIKDVFLEKSSYADPPARFEAGTPAIGETIALGAACDYLTTIGMNNIHQHEMELGKYLYDQLSQLEGVRIYGPDPNVSKRAALCAFNVEGIHATDISTLLDNDGIAVRSGHHCTQPLHRRLGVNASARASVYFYNDKQDVDKFIHSLENTIKFFRQFEQ